jgi:peptidyl-prolyl cis-trans isomerase C
MTASNLYPSPRTRTAPSRQPRTTMAALAALSLLILPAVTGCTKESSSQAAAADPNDTVIARVNGVEIRQSDLAFAEEDFSNELRGAPPDVKREQLITYLTDVIIVSQAAEKKNLGDSAEFKRRQAFLRNKLLMGALLQQRSKEAATEEEMHKVYDDAIKQASNEEEVRARHILVETEDEAKAIAEQLKAGADFATLAKEKSKDPGSAQNGGDLDFMGKSELVPEFADVAFKMFPGQTSNPVKTQFGWHIIKLEEKRTRQPPPYDQLKDRIEAFVARKAQTELVTQLRQTAKVERLDKPATPAIPAPAPGAAPPAAPAPEAAPPAAPEAPATEKK